MKENDKNVNNETIIVNSEVISDIERASIDQQVATAQKFQRNIKLSTEEAEVIVTSSKEIAKSCGYVLKFLKDKEGKVNIVKGKSVYLARIIAQCFGNMRCEQGILYADQTHVTCYGICFDLQKNLASKIIVKKPIIKKNGTRYSEDMIARTGMAGAAIAIRNAIFTVIPAAISELIYNKSLLFLAGEMTDQTKFLHERKRVFKEFMNKYDVTEEEALKCVGLKKIEQLSAEILIDLIDLLNSLESGDMMIETIKGETPLSPGEAQDLNNLSKDVEKDLKNDKNAKKPQPPDIKDQYKNKEEEKPPEKQTGTEQSDKKISSKESESPQSKGEIEFNK